jgi:DNA primase
MVWIPEPAYEKPDISVRATTLYYEIVAPLMLPFVDRRILNLLRCAEGTCFFQRSKVHQPSGKLFKPPIRFEPIAQKNGRTEEYLYVTDAAGIVACAKADAVEFHGWGSRAGSVEKPDRMVIDLDPDPELGFDAVKSAAEQVCRSFQAVGLESFALLSGGTGSTSSSRSGPRPNGTRSGTFRNSSQQRWPRPTRSGSRSRFRRRSGAAGSSSTSSATTARQRR